MAELSLFERLRNARDHTKGFAAVWREVIVLALIIPTTYGVLFAFVSESSAVEEVVAIVVAAIVVLLAMPALEFAWNFAVAPYRLTIERLEASKTAGPEPTGLTPEILSIEDGEWYHQPTHLTTIRGLGFTCINVGATAIRCRIRLVELASWFRQTGVWYQRDAFTPRLLRWGINDNDPETVTIESGSERQCYLVSANTSSPNFALIASGNKQDMANRVLMDIHRARCVVEADGYVGNCREAFFEWRPGPIVLGTQVNELEFVPSEQVPGLS